MVARLAPDLELVLSPNHDPEHGTCQLGGSYPGHVSQDFPSSDSASAWPDPGPATMLEPPPATVQLSAIYNRFIYNCFIPPGLGHTS